MQQQGIGNQIGAFFRSKGLLSGIVMANVVIWLFMSLFGLVEYLFVLGHGTASHTWNEWFALSSEPWWVLTHPWTLLTYMFLHDGVFHLLFNMLLLVVAGDMCCRYMGTKRFGWVYFVSGVGGGLLYLLSYNIFPVFYGHRATLVGASAGVLGVFMAVAAWMPNQPVTVWPFRRLTIKMKWLALIFLALDLMSLTGNNSGGHFAHLGGALCGFLYVVLMRRYTPAKRAERKNIRASRKRQRMKATVNQRPVSDEQYNQHRRQDQQRVDAILDKISQRGYDSLSKEEKEFLFNYK
ncbi:MAG: rhomboid family intramembrane serine protease [Bacteroidales bacterium]|mgnify:FL=1|nr:rhomboid family intramembrane serine protease [Bacteroidales bacterium]